MSGNVGQFQHGIFGCLSDPRLCVLSFCLPCYTVGKNAEGLGEDCLLHGLLACLGLHFGPVIRWRLRQERNIAGSMLMDVLVHTVIPCCAIVQEAKELGWSLPEQVQNAGKKKEKRGNDNPAEVNNEPPEPIDQTPEMTRE